MSKIQPRVTMVGAGPGDAELITIKGMRAIQQADVILYDALANSELLDFASEKARKVFVGKRAGRHYKKQDEINLLLVQNALTYGHVVRLKGGDPFIFGRAQEEMEFLASFDIPVDVIPGISSSIGLATLQRVPLTTRHVSDSFWVITGTTHEGKLSRDMQLAAQSDATVIVLMGIKKLADIVHLYQKEGKDDTPVMIIQNGSRPTEKVALGKVDDILEKAKQHKIGTPGIIVIGDCVRFHQAWPVEIENKVAMPSQTNRA